MDTDKVKYSFSALLPIVGLILFSVLYQVYYDQTKIELGVEEAESGIKSLGFDIVKQEQGVEPSHKVVPSSFKDISAESFVADSMYRILWAIASLLVACASVVTIFIGVIVLWRSFPRWWSIHRYVKIGLSLAALAALWVLGYNISMSGYVGNFLYDISEALSQPQIDARKVVGITMANVLCAIVVITMACCGALHLGSKSDQKSQVQAYRFFVISLVTASILLGCGVIHIFALYKWQTSFLDGENSEFMLRIMTISVSIFYSIALALIFLPTYVLLRYRAWSWVECDSPEMDSEETADFLQKIGIYYTGKNLASIVSVLSSPVLIAMFTEFLKL